MWSQWILGGTGRNRLNKDEITRMVTNLWAHWWSDPRIVLASATAWTTNPSLPIVLKSGSTFCVNIMKILYANVI